MKHDYSPAVLQVVRYGLPLVILIFYVSALWSYSYTPDSTFLSLRMARSLAEDGSLEAWPVHPGAAANPMWLSFLALAAALSLDGLLAAKIFSLFFSSLAVLLSYLLAAEILRDRFLAFCVALSVATSGLLLQAAPAGTALPLALVLGLAGLFFMLRNDYLVSALMLGLGTLVCWQMAGAFVLLLIDAWLNSTALEHRVRTVLFSILVYACPVVAWSLFVALRRVPPIPWMAGLEDFPGLSLIAVAAAGIPAIAAVAAVIGMIRHGRFDGLTGQSHAIIILWACWFAVCSVLWGWDFYLFAVPIIIVYAIGSVQLLASIPRSSTAYVQALLLTGIVILLHQLEFNHAVRPVMARTEKDSEELVELAYWVKNGVPEGSSVSAHRPEILAYYAGRPVRIWETGERPATDYVVSDEEEIWGYDAIQRASRLEDGESVPGAGRYAVWRRK